MTSMQYAGRQAVIQPDWNNPRVVGRNRLPAHAPLGFHQTALEAAGSSGRSLKPTTPADDGDGQAVPGVSLNGVWRFRLYGSVDEVPTDSCLPDFDDSDDTAWGEMPVPANWQMHAAPVQGVGSTVAQGALLRDRPIYLNVRYPFPCKPPHVPQENPTAVYRRRFRVPAAWRGGRVRLTFEAADSNVTVWVNGALCGYSQDSRLACEFDVTHCSLRSDRDNVLVARVSRWCDGSYLEDQDHWWLSGLHREVHLRCEPVGAPAIIADYRLEAPLPRRPTEDAVVTLYVRLRQRSLPAAEEASPQVLVRVRLFEQLWGTPRGLAAPAECRPNQYAPPETCPSTLPPVAEYEEWVLLAGPHWREPVDADRRSECSTSGGWFGNGSPPVGVGFYDTIVSGTMRVPAAAVRAWSPEAPHLFTGIVSLVCPTTGSEPGRAPVAAVAAVEQHEGVRVGFRTVVVREAEGLLRVNGRAVTLAGVNRHEHDDVTGKVVSEESMLRDAMLMKRLNFNAVRCSHYPNHPLWYDICDELGLYLVDEANVETHGMVPVVNPSGLAPATPNGRIAQDPSWRHAFISRISRMCRRDVNHPSIIIWSLGNEAGHGVNLLCAREWLRNFDTTRPVQYESGGCPASLSDIWCPMYATIDEMLDHLMTDTKRPVIPCEYSHAMNNSNGDLHEYWAHIWSQPRLQGGFIWDWVDQGLLQRADSVPGLNDETAGRCGSRKSSSSSRTRRAWKRTDKLGPGQLRGDGGRDGPGRAFWAYGGDFGEKSHDGQFCINGICWPDRTPHPGCLEAAYLQQPVAVELSSADDAESTLEGADTESAAEVVVRFSIRVHSRLDHEDTSHLRFSFELVDDTCGGPDSGAGGASSRPRLCGGELDVPALGPGEAACVPVTVRLSTTGKHIPVGGRWFPYGVMVNITGRLRCETAWAPRGWEVVREQLVIPGIENVCVGSGCRSWAVIRTRSLAGHDELVLTPTTAKGRRRGKQDGAVKKPPSQRLIPRESAAGGAVRVEESEALITMTSVAGASGGKEKPVIAVVDKRTGSLVRYCAGDVELLDRGAGAGGEDRNVEHCFRRAATDNDKGGAEVLALQSGMPTGPSSVLTEVLAPTKLRGFSQRWADLGFDDLTTRVDEIRVDVDDDEAGCSVTVRASHLGGAPGFYYSMQKLLARTITRYVLPGGGLKGVAASGLAVSCSVDTLIGGHRCPLPRVGLRMRVASAFGRMTWFGRGPHECYPDRKSSAFLGTHSASVDSQYVPYIVPSENGGKADCRWVALERDDAPPGSAAVRGIAIVSMEPETDLNGAAPSRVRPAAADTHLRSPGDVDESGLESSRGPGVGPGRALQVSVLRYSLEQLQQATHTHHLPLLPGQAPEQRPPTSHPLPSVDAVVPVANEPVHKDAGGSAAKADEDVDAQPHAGGEPLPIHVHLDARHAGLGGDTSWLPSTRAPWLVQPGHEHYSVRLLPLVGGQKTDARTPASTVARMQHTLA